MKTPRDGASVAHSRPRYSRHRVRSAFRTLPPSRSSCARPAGNRATLFQIIHALRRQRRHARIRAVAVRPVTAVTSLGPLSDLQGQAEARLLRLLSSQNRPPNSDSVIIERCDQTFHRVVAAGSMLVACIAFARYAKSCPARLGTRGSRSRPWGRGSPRSRQPGWPPQPCRRRREFGFVPPFAPRSRARCCSCPRQ